jgi:hypothetical protein
VLRFRGSAASLRLQASCGSGSATCEITSSHLLARWRCCSAGHIGHGRETRIETVNDADCFLANFWRALQADPEGVARHCDWPVNEADLHARHLWLVNIAREHVERCRTEPEYFDSKIAGWWVWGCCQWIGSGWCHHPSQKLPHLGNAGMGVHRPSQQLPHLGDAGRGVHRPSQQLPHLGNAGRGVHRPSQQLPHLGNAGMGVHRPSQQLPHLGNAGRGELYDYLALLASRLRGVRVCCGDWSRVCGPSPTVAQGLTGVFLDPPYTEAAGRKNSLYAKDDLSIGHAVCEWALEWGHDERMRIALCGYEGEYEMPDDWECVAWKTQGGYSNEGKGNTAGRENAKKERIWFSPHCIAARRLEQGVLF